MKFNIKSDKGFTLLEMVISIGIVAVIGTVIVSSVLTANANTEKANVIEFMDHITTQAKENFKAHPEAVLSNASADPIFPYAGMVYTMYSENDIRYEAEYTAGLQRVTSGVTDSKYRMEIQFRGTDKSTTAGFAFKIKTYKMKVLVKEKKNGVELNEPIYDKEYTFDKVTLGDFIDSTPVNPDVTHIVTFENDGGKITDPLTSNVINNAYQKNYSHNQPFGLPSTVPYLTKDDYLFIGWKADQTSKQLIQPSYLIQNAQTVYPYLLENSDTAKEYRVEFYVTPNQRFQIEGITDDEVSKPYVIQKSFPVTKGVVKIADFGEVASKFFSEGAVRENGKEFKYWVNAAGERVSEQSVLNNQNTVLYPYFEDLKGDMEEISLDFKLDLTTVDAGNNQVNAKETRKYAIFPFTKMEYELQYDKNSDSFTLIQTEIYNGEDQTGIKKGDVLSKKEFKTGKSNSFYFVHGGKRYDDISSYIYHTLLDSNHRFDITSINVEVNAPEFDLGDYYKLTFTDTLKMKAGDADVPLDETSAKKLLQSNQKPIFTYKESDEGTHPLFNEDDVKELNERIYEISDGKGSSIINSGNVNYAQNGKATYTTRTVETLIPGGTVEKKVELRREYGIKVYLPVALLNFTGSSTSTTTLDAKVYEKNNQIMIDFNLKYPNGNSALNPSTLTLNTKIPYKQNTVDGTIYNHIDILNFSPDANGYGINVNSIKQENKYLTFINMAGFGYGAAVKGWYPQEAVDRFSEYRDQEIYGYDGKREMVLEGLNKNHTIRFDENRLEAAPIATDNRPKGYPLFPNSGKVNLIAQWLIDQYSDLNNFYVVKGVNVKGSPDMVSKGYRSVYGTTTVKTEDTLVKQTIGTFSTNSTNYLPPFVGFTSYK